jgi:rhamnose transport system permease protein
MSNNVVKQPGNAAPPGGQRRDPFLLLANVRETGIFIFIVVLIIAVTLRAGLSFLNLANFRDIALDIAILIMVAIGQAMVIITRGIDLSIGSGMALSAMTVGLFMTTHWGVPPWAAVLLGIALGCVLGGFNGVLVSVAKVPPIIATLGTLSIYRGLVYLRSGGAWVNADQLSPAFKDFTLRPLFLGIPALVIYALIVAAIFYYFLNYMRTGREIYAVGSNPVAASLAGIRVPRIQFLVFVLSGALYGMGGVMWVSRYANAASNTASGWELQAVAASVVGGVSISGGVGTVPGVILGALFLGIINNAVNLVGISPFWKQGLYGIVILLAVIADMVISRRLQRASTARRVA